MHFDVLGPASGPNVTFYITFVRARGRGAASDPERLEEALSVALPGKDITMDLREVEELGPDGIAALARTSDMVRSGESGEGCVKSDFRRSRAESGVSAPFRPLSDRDWARSRSSDRTPGGRHCGQGDPRTKAGSVPASCRSASSFDLGYVTGRRRLANPELLSDDLGIVGPSLARNALDSLQRRRVEFAMGLPLVGLERRSSLRSENRLLARLLLLTLMLLSLPLGGDGQVWIGERLVRAGLPLPLELPPPHLRHDAHPRGYLKDCIGTHRQEPRPATSGGASGSHI